MTTDADLLVHIDATMADAVQRSGAWIACRPGCTECCLGPFEITALDAVRLRTGIARLGPAIRSRVLARARAYVPAEDVPCPVLDPETGLCDLYDSRPVTCRIFGPATITEEGVAACELCYAGATDAEIAACAVRVDPDALESTLLARLDGGLTTVAQALTGE